MLPFDTEGLVFKTTQSNSTGNQQKLTKSFALPPVGVLAHRTPVRQRREQRERTVAIMKKIREGEVYRFPESACLASVSTNGGIVLVTQQRPVHGKTTIELPGGKVRENENAYDCAVREFLEETGLVASAPELLFSLDMDFSTSFHKTHVFLDDRVGELLPKKDAQTVELLEAFRLVKDGSVTHAPTVAALMYLRSRF